MFQFVTVAKVKEGTLDFITKAANVLAEETRKEKGNIYYYLLQALEAPDTLIFVEAWEDEADFQGHANGAPCKKFGETMDPSLAGPVQAYPCRVIA
ncbi:antibiotic biosynthesis monooxygenase [Dehalobacter sp. DCM]|uniref:putative quinol monooxygenase n=1 Tax=Dehalobacter sp. DCM TaxID=2907827 RepID=UPI0030820A03|nr:antibiotic biosynthesis monooxygenase [Dehalobacter sp. DCM]